MVRSMMSQTTLPKSFWDYALETAARILNMVPSKKVDKTPYEIWHGQAPKLSYLRVWGCEAFVKHDTLTKPDKLDPRSFKCIIRRIPKGKMGYSFYSPSENKVFVARNAEFFEQRCGFIGGTLRENMSGNIQLAKKKQCPKLHFNLVLIGKDGHVKRKHNKDPKIYNKLHNINKLLVQNNMQKGEANDDSGGGSYAGKKLQKSLYFLIIFIVYKFFLYLLSISLGKA
ncbi:retrotransposon protein, putative, ty1-copia subclass [Tanacetum coccineum]|uniref:Retrotransposon protein, putative, ty1-copia subclass n=1 Tax=Tanacetum coccineum TaxID=301880 RepID=A0ABQ5IYJ2_9ASTR